MTFPKHYRILTAVLILSASAMAWRWLGSASIDGERRRLEQEIESLARQSRLAVEEVTREEQRFAEHGVAAAQARVARLQREMARRRERIQQLQAQLAR